MTMNLKARFILFGPFVAASGLLSLAYTHAAVTSAPDASVEAKSLEPLRQGTLHYIVDENSFTRPENQRTVIGHHQEVCKGEMKIPVFDLMVKKSGIAFRPQRIQCKVETDNGPMEVVLGSYIELRNLSGIFSKVSMPGKILELSFGLVQQTPSGSKSVSNNFFSTSTRDLSQSTIDLQTQTDSITTKVGSKDVTDSFSIRAEFEEPATNAAN